MGRLSQIWTAIEEDENHSKQPHAGHGASPGGHDGSIQICAPHTGQSPELPSGVRDEMFMVHSVPPNELAQWPGPPSTWKAWLRIHRVTICTTAKVYFSELHGDPPSRRRPDRDFTCPVAPG